MEVTSSPAVPAVPALSLAGRISAAVKAFTEATGLPLGYLICAPLALLAIWGHRYPPGVDLPEHAELVKIWMEVRRGTPDFVNLYQLKTLTPYTLSYVVAYPVAVFFGAKAGIKFVLTLAVLGTPWMMTRWLRVVGGDPRLGVIGFAVVFGWAFLWGFLSHMFGLVFLFAYLTSLEEQGVNPPPARLIETLCWAVVLFFCHGVTFGVAMVAAGARLVLRPHPLVMWKSWLHFFPLGALTLYWAHLQEKAVEDKPGPWLMDFGRLKILFSGFFCVQVNTYWAEVVTGILLAWFLFTLPRINWRPAAWIPLLCTIALFAILPSHIVATELIGPRFSVYVQAFMPGIWLARPGRWERHFVWTPVVLVAAALIVLNVRIYKYNLEMDHYEELTAKVEPGSDIKTYQPNSGGYSEMFGYRGQALAASWFTAEHGGILEDDYAARFNMPVQRKKVNFPRRYRYIFTFADQTKVKKEFPDAELLAKSGPWSLYERKPLKFGKWEIIRSGQGWDELHVDESVVKTPLSIAGVTYDHGIGTHADSWIELRGQPGETVQAKCGLDDSGREVARVLCGYREIDGRFIHRGPVIRKGDPPVQVSATFPANGILFLEINALGMSRGPNGELIDITKGAHGDWVDIQ